MADDPLSTTVRFTLTRSDALAWERTRFRPGVAASAGTALWIIACAAASLLLPAAPAPMGIVTLVALGLVFAAIGAVLVLIGLSFRQWQAAGRHIARPAELTVTAWPDHFDIAGAALPPRLAYRDIRESLLTETHLFLDSDEGLLILPRAAWPEPGDTAALAARLARPPLAPVDAGAAPA